MSLIDSQEVKNFIAALTVAHMKDCERCKPKTETRKAKLCAKHKPIIADHSRVLKFVDALTVKPWLDGSDETLLDETPVWGFSPQLGQVGFADTAENIRKVAKMKPEYDYFMRRRTIISPPKGHLPGNDNIMRDATGTSGDEQAAADKKAKATKKK